MGKSHFLNDRQKEVKQKIMEELMSAFFDNIQKNIKIFNSQNLVDLIGSILIMFNRDVITHTILSFDLNKEKDILMDSLFEEIKNQVNLLINRNKDKLN